MGWLVRNLLFFLSLFEFLFGNMGIYMGGFLVPGWKEERKKKEKERKKEDIVDIV